MSLHLVGQPCQYCNKKGLVVGKLRPKTNVAFPMNQTFQPEGWRLDRLECFCAACPQCGYISLALSPTALKKLKDELRRERMDESVTYHAKRKKKKSKLPPGPGRGRKKKKDTD